MRKYIVLAAFAFISGVNAHTENTDFYRSNFSSYQAYSKNDYVVPRAVFNTPLVYNTRYAPSQIPQRVTRTNSYNVSTYNYNNSGVSYNTDNYYRSNASRYNQPTYNHRNSNTTYAYGVKKHQPARPQYQRAQSSCSFGY